MRVLALVTDAFGGYGGMAQYNRDLFRALSNSALVKQVVALPRVGNPEGDVLPPRVAQFAAKFGRSMYSLNALVTARKQGPFDVIFCGHLFHLPLAVALGRAFRIPVWLQTHGIEAWDRPSRLLQAAMARTALVTTVSRYTRAQLIKWADVSPDRIRVLPNTVRPSFTRGPTNAATLAKFGLTGAKIILTVSRINKVDLYKGHRRVIEAMPAVREAEPRANYVVVGDGDGREDLEGLAEGRGLSDAVKFLGRLDDQDVIDLCRSSDVFVMPSTKEGFGIAFLEAAATGLPVVAGNRDGSVDALADGAIGRLIDLVSTEELTSALIDGLNGRIPSAADAAQRFSFANFAAHVDALVRNLAR